MAISGFYVCYPEFGNLKLNINSILIFLYNLVYKIKLTLIVVNCP